MELAVDAMIVSDDEGTSVAITPPDGGKLVLFIPPGTSNRVYPAMLAKLAVRAGNVALVEIVMHSLGGLCYRPRGVLHHSRECLVIEHGSAIDCAAQLEQMAGVPLPRTVRTIVLILETGLLERVPWHTIVMPGVRAEHKCTKTFDIDGSIAMDTVQELVAKDRLRFQTALGTINQGHTVLQQLPAVEDFILPFLKRNAPAADGAGPGSTSTPLPNQGARAPAAKKARIRKG